MNDIGGIPYTQVHFDNDGRRLNEPTVPPGTTDLVVVSHGWNNDEADATTLYTKLFTNLAQETAGDAAFGQRRLAILGVIWPAKKFNELMTHIEGTGPATGGAKSLGASDKASAVQTMLDAIDRAATLFDSPADADRRRKIESLKDLAPKLEDDPRAQEQFVLILRQVLDRGDATSEQAHREDSSDVLLESQPSVVFANATRSAPAGGTGGPASEPPKASASVGSHDPQGRAAGFGAFFSAAANAVTNLLNVTTYFEMKQRAGTVGKQGVAPMMDELAGQVERIHLVGHSFGARVVTAAAANS